MKILTIFVCVCLMLSLAACGSATAGNETQGAPETQEVIETTQGTLPQEGPNENQCAGDPTLDTEDEEFVEETEETAESEAPVEEENEELSGEEPEEEEPGDIQIPIDEIEG